MNKLTVLFTLFCSLISISYGMTPQERYEREQQYVKKYPCPAFIKDALNKVLVNAMKKSSRTDIHNLEQVILWGGPHEISTIPNFLFKSGINRLVGAHIIKSVITQKNLDCFLSHKNIFAQSQIRQ